MYVRQRPEGCWGPGARGGLPAVLRFWVMLPPANSGGRTGLLTSGGITYLPLVRVSARVVVLGRHGSTRSVWLFGAPSPCGVVNASQAFRHSIRPERRVGCWDWVSCGLLVFFSALLCVRAQFLRRFVAGARCPAGPLMPYIIRIRGSGSIVVWGSPQRSLAFCALADFSLPLEAPGPLATVCQKVGPQPSSSVSNVQLARVVFFCRSFRW